MKKPGSGLNTGINDKWLQEIQAMSYQNLASELADEMIGFMRPSESCKCSPPFNMVIIDNRGTVVFECNVSREGKVRPFGLVRRVQHSHFPATALLTDRLQVARIFLIKYCASNNDSN